MHFTPGHDHYHEALETGGLDARAKIVAWLGLAIAGVLTPRGQWPVLGAYGACWLLLCLALAAPLLKVLRRVIAASPFFLLLAVLLPFRPLEPGDHALALGPLTLSAAGSELALDMAAKATLSVACVAALASTESLAGITRGMQRLGAPALFVTLMNFTFRYLLVLREETQRMKRARDARAFGGRWLWHARVVGLMIGSLFLRSIERAERVHQAMASRGYSGGAFAVSSRALSGAEWLLIASCLLLFVVVRLLPL